MWVQMMPAQVDMSHAARTKVHPDGSRLNCNVHPPRQQRLRAAHRPRRRRHVSSATVWGMRQWYVWSVQICLSNHISSHTFDRTLISENFSHLSGPQIKGGNIGSGEKKVYFHDILEPKFKPKLKTTLMVEYRKLRHAIDFIR